MEKHIPEILKPISMMEPQTTNGTPDSEELDLKNAHNAYIVVHLAKGSSEATELTIEESEDGSGHDTVENNVRIWANEDVSDDDDLERQDDAKTYTVTGDDKDKLIVFQVDPRAISGDNNEVRVNVSGGGDGSDYISVVGYVAHRYQNSD